MATNTPQPPSPNTDSRSAILLWLLAAAGITGAAASAIINIINKDHLKNSRQRGMKA